MIQESKLDFRYFYPEVIQAVAVPGYIVYAYMNDGSIRRVALKDLIFKDEVFSMIREPSVFQKKCTVIGYTVAWDLAGNRDPEKCLDIDPFFVFQCPMVMEEEVLGALSSIDDSYPK